GHGVLLGFGAPSQLRLLAGQEHGRTIPLADMDRALAADKSIPLLGKALSGTPTNQMLPATTQYTHPTLLRPPFTVRPNAVHSGKRGCARRPIEGNGRMFLARYSSNSTTTERAAA